MPAIHFQSIFQFGGHVQTEPLCTRFEAREEPVTLLKHEVTCPFCLGFLLRLKESSNA